AKYPGTPASGGGPIGRKHLVRRRRYEWCRRLRQKVETGRRHLRARECKALNHRDTGPFGQIEMPALFNALENGAGALVFEGTHHRLQESEAGTGIHELRDPVRIELDDIRPEILDAADGGIVRPVVVYRYAEAIRSQCLNKLKQDIEGRGALFSNLAHDTTGVDTCLMQNQPHLAQSRFRNGTIDEDGRIEVHEDRRLLGQMGGVEQMERARQRLDVETICGCAGRKEGARWL